MGQLTLHRIRRNSLMVPCRDNLKSADLSVCERNFRIDLFESKFSDRFCLSSRRVVLRRSHPVVPIVPEATQGATELRSRSCCLCNFHIVHVFDVFSVFMVLSSVYDVACVWLFFVFLNVVSCACLDFIFVHRILFHRCCMCCSGSLNSYWDSMNSIGFHWISVGFQWNSSGTPLDFNGAPLDSSGTSLTGSTEILLDSSGTPLDHWKSFIIV